MNKVTRGYEMCRSLHTVAPIRSIVDRYPRILYASKIERFVMRNSTIEKAAIPKTIRTSRLRPTQAIRKVRNSLTDQRQTSSESHSVQDPLLASVEARLRVWLNTVSMPDRQIHKTETEPKDLNPLEMMIVSPPINRTHMPTANLECKPIRSMVRAVANALTTARSLIAQHLRRLLAKIRSKRRI